MIKISLMSVLLFACSFSVNAQWTTSGSVTSTTNKIGIGTGSANPNTNLQVNGTVLATGTLANIAPAEALGNLNYLANTGSMLTAWNRSSGFGETDFINNQGPGLSGGFAFYNHNNSNVETRLMFIKGNGQVMIGDTQGKEGSYTFAVAGSAVATSMTVKTVPNWPDYVFEKAYTLPDLNEVKIFIDLNHHLPDVPSADQVAKNGLDLGEINKILLRKVEELTLYLLESKRKQAEQEQRLIKLEQQSAMRKCPVFKKHSQSTPK